VSLVRYRSCCSPAISGTLGYAPVAISAWSNPAAARAAVAMAAAARSALDGTQPVHKQSPAGLRLTFDQRDPRPVDAAVLAATMPAVPPPTTIRSQLTFSTRIQVFLIRP